MAAQPASQTRLHTYQRMRRLFDLAIYPCKLRPEGANPVLRYLRPEKLFCYLYPVEVLALLDGDAIPLGRRVLFALAVYTGLRKASLYSIRWSGIDFEHGTILALKTKGRVRLGKRRGAQGKKGEEQAGGRPVLFQGDPSLMQVLDAWREVCGRPAPSESVVRDVAFERGHDEAKVLRADLRAVGVTRELLFSDAPTVEPLRFHDTRATFVTWAKRAGRSDAWISERTGHLTKAMIDRYTRFAQTLADLNYEPFPKLDVLRRALLREVESSTCPFRGPGRECCRCRET